MIAIFILLFTLIAIMGIILLGFIYQIRTIPNLDTWENYVFLFLLICGIAIAVIVLVALKIYIFP